MENTTIKKIDSELLKSKQGTLDMSHLTMYEVRQMIDLDSFTSGDFEAQTFNDHEDFESYLDCVLDPLKLQYTQEITCSNGIVRICEKWS